MVGVKESGTGSGGTCFNEPDPSRDPPHRVDSKIAFLWDAAGAKNIPAFPKPEEGGAGAVDQRSPLHAIRNIPTGGCQHCSDAGRHGADTHRRGSSGPEG